MANYTDRFPENVPGPWYVDDNCISCGLCEDRAPESFKLHSGGMHNYVHAQPRTPSALAAAEDAREACPVEAIGNDGPAPVTKT